MLIFTFVAWLEILPESQKYFKGRSTSTLGRVDKLVELRSVEFLLEVFPCITSQPYLILSLFNFWYFTITK